jgi:hypothetical protein
MPERFAMRVLLTILLLAVPCGLQAQVVRGRVLDGSSNQPIRAVTLELLDDRDRVTVQAGADSAGNFRIRSWQAGRYRLRASALGYGAATSELLELATGEEFELNVRLAPQALPIEPITVVGRSRSSLTDIALRGYYDRRAAGGRVGLGRFLDRADIERMGTRLSDVLARVPGLRIVRSGSCVFVAVAGNPTGTKPLTPTAGGRTCAVPAMVCPARVYLDGMPLRHDDISLDQQVPLDWVEAIEAYRRPSELPAEFLGSGACGVVAIWTRRG